MLPLSHLWQRRWDPWSEEWPKMTHAYRWPAKYGGGVWMDLRPGPHDVDQGHRLHLAWGPWGYDLEIPLPREGRVLFTGKAEDDDGIARTLNLDSDRLIFVLWGAGDIDLTDPRVIDIRRGWRRAEPPGPEDGHGPAFALDDYRA